MISFVKDVVATKRFAYGATVGALPWAIVFQLFPTHDVIASTYLSKDQYRTDQQQLLYEVRETRQLVQKLYEERRNGK